MQLWAIVGFVVFFSVCPSFLHEFILSICRLERIQVVTAIFIRSWFELLVIYSQHYSLFKFVLALEEFLKFLLAKMVDM